MANYYQTFGTVDQPGPPGGPFNEPTRAVLSTSGEMYVSDGYGQSRGTSDDR